MLKWLLGLCWASVSSCQGRVIETHAQNDPSPRLLHISCILRLERSHFEHLNKIKVMLAPFPHSCCLPESLPLEVQDRHRHPGYRCQFQTDTSGGVSLSKTPFASSAPETLVTLSRERAGRKGVMVTVGQKWHE